MILQTQYLAYLPPLFGLLSNMSSYDLHNLAREPNSPKKIKVPIAHTVTGATTPAKTANLLVKKHLKNTMPHSSVKLCTCHKFELNVYLNEQLLQQFSEEKRPSQRPANAVDVSIERESKINAGQCEMIFMDYAEIAFELTFLSHC